MGGKSVLCALCCAQRDAPAWDPRGRTRASGFTAPLWQEAAVGDTGPKHNNYEKSEGDLDEGGGTGGELFVGTFPLVNRRQTSGRSSLWQDTS